jgi:nicotinate dehydrogenase subunit A
MSQTFHLHVNGASHAVRCEPDAPLLYILRNDLGLNSPKFGCGAAQCGSCAVLLDGQELRSCVMPVSAIGKGRLTTLEGLAGGSARGGPNKPVSLHPLQRAFLEEQAAQCGYCTSGMIVAAKALLDRTPRPSEAEIRSALDGHICRCGTQNRIVKAVLRAARGNALVHAGGAQ